MDNIAKWLRKVASRIRSESVSFSVDASKTGVDDTIKASPVVASKVADSVTDAANRATGGGVDLSGGVLFPKVSGPSLFSATSEEGKKTDQAAQKMLKSIFED